MTVALALLFWVLSLAFVSYCAYRSGVGAGKASGEEERVATRRSRSLRYEIVVAEIPAPQYVAEKYRWEVRDADAEGEHEPFAVGLATTRAEADVRALAAVVMIRRRQPSSVVVS